MILKAGHGLLKALWSCASMGSVNKRQGSSDRICITANSLSLSRRGAEILISSVKAHHMEIYIDGTQHVGATLQMRYNAGEPKHGPGSSSECDNKRVAGRTSFLPEIRRSGIPEVLH